MQESLAHKIEKRFIKVGAKCPDDDYKMLQVVLSKYYCLVCLPGKCHSKEDIIRSVGEVESDHMHYLHGVGNNVVLLFRCTRKPTKLDDTLYIDSIFFKNLDWRAQLLAGIDERQRAYREEDAIVNINGTLLPGVKGVSALYEDTGVKNNTVSIVASGTSVNELTDKELTYIKSRSLMFGINYSVVRFNPHVLIWADHEPAQYLSQFYKSNKKKTLLLGSVHSVKGNERFGSLIGSPFWQSVDYWWTPEGMLKNLTLTWLLQLLHIHFPPDIRVLLFGVDLYGTEKWYDSYIGFDKAKKLLENPEKEDSVAITGKDLQRTQLYMEELLSVGKIPGNIYNCNPGSKLELFEKVPFRKIL